MFNDNANASACHNVWHVAINVPSICSVNCDVGLLPSICEYNNIC